MKNPCKPITFRCDQPDLGHVSVPGVRRGINFLPTAKAENVKSKKRKRKKSSAPLQRENSGQKKRVFFFFIKIYSWSELFISLLRKIIFLYFKLFQRA